MTPFFRRIRHNLANENQFLKYSRYAIGEIVLVVIGILIALSINNWNEERKNDRKESLLIKNIIEDLSLDLAHINQSLHELENQMNVVDDLIGKVLDSDKILNQKSTGLVRYSSDFRPLSQRNHAESVSSLENEGTRKILQKYFLKEDQVMDMFKEYENIIHNNIRPHLRDVGMHNLKSLHEDPNEMIQVLLQAEILEEQLGNIKFQQLLFERRLKTQGFKLFLEELKIENKELIKNLSSNNA